MCLFKVVMIIDECQEKMNCLYSLVNVSSVITDLSLSIFIAGGGGRSFGGNTWFSGGTEGVSGILIQPPTPPAPAPPTRPRPRPSPPLNTQYLVTVDLFFSNICRGVFGIPCTRLRHNCVVNQGTLFSKNIMICITMAVSVASQRR